MKKIYIQPRLYSSFEITVHPMCLSGVKGNNGIGYGGIDEEGEKDPSVRDLNEDEDFFNMLIEQELVEKKSLW